MLTLLRDSKQRALLGENAVKQVLTLYAPRVVGKQLADLYRLAVDGTRA
jgi:hypothetical protein